MARLQSKIGVAFIFLFSLLFINACTSVQDDGMKKTYCNVEDRRADVCIQLAKPVCGWDNNGEVGTYSNSCYACKDSKVEYWIEGECEIITEEPSETKEMTDEEMLDQSLEELDSIKDL